MKADRALDREVHRATPGAGDPGSGKRVGPDEGALEQGRPGADARAFRRCLGQFGSGVTVITAMSPGRPIGVTVNSFASVSLDPPLVLWSLSRTSTSYDAFRQSSHFVVNVLASDQTEVAARFAKSGEDK